MEGLGLRCELCQERFDDTQTLISHLDVVHVDKTDDLAAFFDADSTVGDCDTLSQVDSIVEDQCQIDATEDSEMCVEKYDDFSEFDREMLSTAVSPEDMDTLDEILDNLDKSSPSSPEKSGRRQYSPCDISEDEVSESIVAVGKSNDAVSESKDADLASKNVVSESQDQVFHGKNVGSELKTIISESKDSLKIESLESELQDTASETQDDIASILSESVCDKLMEGENILDELLDSLDSTSKSDNKNNFNILNHINDSASSELKTISFEKVLDSPSKTQVQKNINKGSNKLLGSRQNFQCKKCSKFFGLEKYLKRHQISVCRAAIFTCPDCKQTFHTQKTLAVHCTKKHPKSKRDAERQCDQCFKVLFNKSVLARHKKEVHGKLFQCDLCTRVYHKKSGLLEHKKVHNTLDMKIKDIKINFTCDICCNSFVSNSGLKRHMKHVHSTAEYKCDQCKGVFKYKKSLTSHMRKHHAMDVESFLEVNLNHEDKEESEENIEKERRSEKEDTIVTDIEIEIETEKSEREDKTEERINSNKSRDHDKTIEPERDTLRRKETEGEIEGTGEEIECDEDEMSDDEEWKEIEENERRGWVLYRIFNQPLKLTT